HHLSGRDRLGGEADGWLLAVTAAVRIDRSGGRRGTRALDPHPAGLWRAGDSAGQASPLALPEGSRDRSPPEAPGAHGLRPKRRFARMISATSGGTIVSQLSSPDCIRASTSFVKMESRLSS